MPRRPLFSPSERASLLRPPEEESELSCHYSFSETDLALIGQRRGKANRLGFAVQLCLLRYPGQGLLLKGAAGEIPAGFLHWIGSRLKIDPACWPGYFLREATRREHLIELRAYLELRPFAPGDLRQSIAFLTELAMRTDKGTVIAAGACTEWRRRKVMIPPLDLVERICAAALTRANRQICAILADPCRMCSGLGWTAGWSSSLARGSLGFRGCGSQTPATSATSSRKRQPPPGMPPKPCPNGISSRGDQNSE